MRNTNLRILLLALLLCSKKCCYERRKHNAGQTRVMLAGSGQRRHKRTMRYLNVGEFPGPILPMKLNFAFASPLLLPRHDLDKESTVNWHRLTRDFTKDGHCVTSLRLFWTSLTLANLMRDSLASLVNRRLSRSTSTSIPLSDEKTTMNPRALVTEVTINVFSKIFLPAPFY